MAKPPPALCGDCKKLIVNRRKDFWPNHNEYYCNTKKSDNWLGFIPVRRCKAADAAERGA